MFARLKKNPICYLGMRMWQFGKERRKVIVMTMIGSLVAMMTWLTIPLVMARFINQAQQAASDDALIECGMLLAFSALIGVVAWVFHGPSRVAEMITSVSARRNLQLGLLRKVTALPMKWHTHHHSGETIDRVARAGSALSEFADASFMVIQLSGRLIGAMVMMSIFMPEAGVIVAVSTALAVAMIVAFDKVLVPLYEKGNTVLNQVAAKVQDYLTNITTVISLRLEDRVIHEVDQQLEKYLPITRRTSAISEVKWFVTNLLVDLTRVVTLFWFVMKAVQEKRMVELGTLVALNEYLTALGSSFFEFTWKWGDFVVKATRLRAIEEMERDYDTLVGDVSSERLPAGWRKLHVSGLSFQHEATAKESAGVFDIDVTFERGKSYAVVGISGSGKSTLLSLLRGLQRAQTGSVVCDGVIVESGLVAVSHHTTLIPQDPEVFADTIVKNVTMGIEAPTEKVLHAIEIAQFTEVLADLPKGLETNIAEKGISLSGGQRQRLALARGIFFAFDSDSEIILMDESTSSVDIANEERIYEALLRHFRSELIIATTHKFNLLPMFDEIIVMQSGRIVERGALGDLVAEDGVLAAMWRQYKGTSALPPRAAHA
jgi:ATP-binding cassette subfamily B protein